MCLCAPLFIACSSFQQVDTDNSIFFFCLDIVMIINEKM